MTQVDLSQISDDALNQAASATGPTPPPVPSGSAGAPTTQGVDLTKVSDDALNNAAAQMATQARIGQSAAIRNNIYNAQGVNPVQAGQQAALAQKTGLPIQTVQAHPNAANAAATLSTLDPDALAVHAPATASLLADPTTAPIIYQQIGPMAAFEGAIKQIVHSVTQAANALPNEAGNELGAVIHGLGNQASGLFEMPARAIGGLLNMLPNIPAGFGTDQTLQGQWAQGLSDIAATRKADELPANASFGTQVAGGLGNLAGVVAQSALGGGALEGLAQTGTAGHILAASALPSFQGAYDTWQSVYDKTQDPEAATKAALASYMLGTAQMAFPISIPGGIATRALSGAAAAVPMTFLSNEAMNAALPQSMQSNDPYAGLTQQAILQGGLAAMLGEPAAPHTLNAVRQTYTDAAKAAAAQADYGRLTVLDSLSQNLHLRESNPEAFQQFAQDASEGGATDFYVNAQKLTDALQQNPAQAVALQEQMPDVMAQLADAGARGGDVSIPISQYATHLMGTPTGDALRPDVRVSPDGMTYSEGQTYYQNYVQDLADQASALAAQHLVTAKQKSDFEDMANNVAQQLDEVGAHSPEVNRALATLAASGYEARAQSEGLTLPELRTQHPLSIRGEGVAGETEGLDALQQAGPLPRDVQARAEERVRTSLEGLKEQYRTQNTDAGGTLHINPDNARELFPEYAASPEARTRFAAAVQKGASTIARGAYSDALARPVAGGHEPRVVFVGGGAGSGKSSVHNLFGDLLKNADIVHDTTMKDFGRAKNDIDAALASGRKATVVFVARHPIDAFHGVLARAAETGRTVPLEAFLAGHNGAAATLRKLAEHYRGNPNVDIHIVDNTGAMGAEAHGNLDTLDKLAHTELEQHLIDVLDKEHQNGRISQTIYDATRSVGAPPQLGGNTVGEKSAAGVRPDLHGQAFRRDEPKQPERQAFPGVSELRTDNGSRGSNSDGRGSDRAAQRAAASDFTRAGVNGLLGKTHWAILTAENPHGEPASAEDNARNQAALEAQLKERGYDVEHAVGNYGGVENSLIVRGITEAEAHDLGNQYGQDSVLTPRGLVYHNGDVSPATGITAHDTAPDDFYTRTAGGDTFTVDLGDRRPGVAGELDTPTAGAHTETIATPQEVNHAKQSITGSVALVRNALRRGVSPDGSQRQSNAYIRADSSAGEGQPGARVPTRPLEVARWQVAPDIARLFHEAGVSTPDLIETSDAEHFAKQLEDARSANKNGFMVLGKSAEDLKGHRMFVTEDGSVGFAIKPDGELTAVFKHPNSPHARAMESALFLATQSGATKTAAFDALGVLPNLYARAGFRPVMRAPFEADKFPAWPADVPGLEVVYSVLDHGYQGKYSPETTPLVGSFAEARSAPVWTQPVAGLVGVHYSRAPREALDGTHYGEGVRGAEKKRLDQSPDDRLRQRLHFYVDEGTGAHPEVGVGTYRHEVPLSDMYDAKANPLRIPTHDYNAFESGVLDAGYKGYYVRKGFGDQGTAVMLGEHSLGVRPHSVVEERLRQEEPADRANAKTTVEVPGLGHTGGNVNDRGSVIATTKTGLKNFWNWFGASEAKTDSGKPVLMYHATDRSFDSFRPERQDDPSATLRPLQRTGIFMTPELHFAEIYRGGKPGHNVMPLYLKIENPLDMREGLTDDHINQLAKTGASKPWLTALRDDSTHDWELFDGEDGAAFVDRLKQAGYDGAIIREEDVARPMETSEDGLEEPRMAPVYIAFDPEQIKSAIGNAGTYDASANIVHQKGDGTAKGYYTPQNHTITLTKHADLSTFVHELGHHFLEMTADLAGREGASDLVRQDMGALLKWFGVPDMDAWRALSPDARRDAHEKFARTFEHYLFDGKAPSVDLQPVFARVRSWMMTVYGNLKRMIGLHPEAGDLSPEIRGVFDRLLASENAIKEAEGLAHYSSLWGTPELAGISKEAFAEYRALGEDATAQAVDAMQQRSLRDMKWASRARAKVLRALQKEAAATRRNVKDAVSKEVAQWPIHQARDLLKGRESPTTKLDKATLNRMYPQGTLDLSKLSGMTKEKGVHPDMVAERFGFPSGDALVRQLAAGDTRQADIAGLTDQRMLEQHGDLSSVGDISAAADAAIHNTARAKFMATGLKILTKSPLSARLLLKGAKDAATKTVNSTKVGALNVIQYTRQEARSNREALKQAPKDPAAAAQAQREALLNNQLAESARTAKQQVTAALAYFKRFDKGTIRDGLDGHFLEQIDALLSRVDLRKNPTDVNRPKERLEDWAAGLQANGYEPQIAPWLLGMETPPSYKDLTVEQLTGLHDTVKSLAYIGRQANLIRTKNGEQTVKDAVQEIVTRLQERPDKFTKADILTPPRAGDGVWSRFTHWAGVWMRAGVNDLDIPEVKFNKYDRHDLDGPMRKYILEPLFSRTYWKADTLKAITAHFGALGDKLGKEWQDSMTDAVTNDLLKDPDLSEEGQPPVMMRLKRGDLLGIARHVGNEDNFAKLVKGYGWAPADVWRLLDRELTEKDWQAVQAGWDVYDPLWAQTEEMTKRLGGVMPKKIEARAFPTKFGTVRGGYAPISYDPLRSALAARKGEFSLDAKSGIGANDFMPGSPTTVNRSLNKRVENYTDRVDFGLHTFEANLRATVHDLAYHEVLLDARKIVNKRAFREQFQLSNGREEYASLVRWLEGVKDINRKDTANTRFERALSYGRKGLVMTGIGYRLSTVLKHGSSAALKTLGYMGTGAGRAYFTQRLARMVYDGPAQIEEAKAKFDEIRFRARQQDRDYSEGTRSMFAPESIMAKNERFGHAFVAWSDLATAVPTAWAAYDLARLKGVPKSMGGKGVPMSEEDAVAYANSVVRQAHGTALESARSTFMQGGPLKGLFGMLYGFMNNSFGQQRDMWDKVFKEGHFNNKPEVAARLLASVILPGLMTSWIINGTPDINNENPVWWAMKAMLAEVAATVPFLRDAVQYAEYGREDAAAPLQVLMAPVKVGKDAYQSLIDDKHTALWQDAGNAIGEWGHVAGLGEAGHIVQYYSDVAAGTKPQPDSGLEAIKNATVGGAPKNK